MVDDGRASWTLEELVTRVTHELAARGLLGAQRDGRVAAAPDARTVRYYQSIGLIDRPRVAGREARYMERQRLQLLAIKALQTRGVPLADVQKRLYGRSDAELAACVAEAISAPVTAPGKATPTSRTAAEPAGVTHLVEIQMAPGVRLVINTGAEPPADTASLQEAIVAALAAWQRTRAAGEGGR